MRWGWLLVLCLGACDCDRSEDPEETSEAAETETEAETEEPEEESEEPETAELVTGEGAEEVVAFVRGISEAWNEGDRERYLGFFADELECFHGTGNLTKEQFEAQRLRRPMEDTRLYPDSVFVVSRSDDSAVAIEHGAWLSRARRSGVHRKAYWLKRHEDSWLVTAEVRERDTTALGNCGMELLTLLPGQPTKLAHCEAQIRACDRRCAPNCRDAEAEDCASCRSGCGEVLAECLEVEAPEWPDAERPRMSQEEIDRLERHADQLRRFAGQWPFLGDLADAVDRQAAGEAPPPREEEEELPPVEETFVVLSDGMGGDGPRIRVDAFLSRIPPTPASEQVCRGEMERCGEDCSRVYEAGYNGWSVCMMECARTAACFLCGDTASCCSLVYDEPQVKDLIRQRTGGSCGNDTTPDYIYR